MIITENILIITLCDLLFSVNAGCSDRGMPCPNYGLNGIKKPHGGRCVAGGVSNYQLTIKSELLDFI